MTNYLTLPTGDAAPAEVNAVIEIPRGQTNKYEYDKQLHVFRLDRNLYSPVHYPGDYGFIPSTLSLDGGPLDVLVLVDAPSFTGCVMVVRPIGVLKMIDQGSEDEKILAVGLTNPIYKDVEITINFIRTCCWKSNTSSLFIRSLRQRQLEYRAGRTRQRRAKL